MTMIMDTAAPGTAKLESMLRVDLPAKWRSELLSGFGDTFRDDADPEWLTPSDE